MDLQPQKDLEEISRQLELGKKELHRSIQSLDKWGARVLKAFHINDYADYPKRTGKSF